MNQFVVLSQTFWCHGTNRKAVVAVTFVGFCIGANACPRVSAAQPDAFWLACDRGCDTLFAHDSARQKKCLDLQVKSPFVRVNAVVSIIALSGFA